MKSKFEGSSAVIALALVAVACSSSSATPPGDAGGGGDVGTSVSIEAGPDGSAGVSAEAGADAPASETGAASGDAAGGDSSQAAGDASQTGDDAAPCNSTELYCAGICVPNDELNCGTCGADCTTRHVTSAVACVAGQCSFPSVTCAAGWAHCSSQASDGCEADLSKATHCGSCSNVCTTSPTCVDTAGTYSCVGPVAIACAYEASFAAFGNGTVKSWGNDSGEAIDNPGVLGKGSFLVSNTSLPGLVTGITTAAKVAAGDAHACALLSDGTVQCWGDNSYGQIGSDSSVDPNSTMNYTATPVVVAGVSGVTALAAGVVHTCALISDGTVKCWGSNDHGELGSTESAECNGFDKCSTTPTTVPGLTNVTAIAIGGTGEYFADHTCALISDGTVKCWGFNGSGETGSAATPGAGTATPTVVSGIANATGVATMATASCAVISGGTVECWGDNSDGELGDGTTNAATTPISVQGLTDAASLSSGSTSYFACAVRTSGAAVCWGDGYNGELGDGSPDTGEQGPFSSPPLAVASLTNIVEIATGGNSACALLATGDVDCWGFNGDGQLGRTTSDNNFNSAPLPVQW